MALASLRIVRSRRSDPSGKNLPGPDGLGRFALCNYVLGSLVERGLLEMRYEGKAQVFTVRDDFKRRLAERYGV